MFKELTTAIRSKLKENDTLRWVDLDKGQMEMYDSRPAIDFPAALFTIQFPRTENEEEIKGLKQQAECLITVRICWDFTGNTSGITSDAEFDRSMAFAQLLQEVYQELQAFSDGRFNKLERISLRDERRNDKYKVMNMVFRTATRDHSVIETILIPILSLELDENATQNLASSQEITPIVATADALASFIAPDLPEGLTITPNSDGMSATVTGSAPAVTTQFTIIALGRDGGVFSKAINLIIGATSNSYIFNADTLNIEVDSSDDHSLRIPIVNVDGTAIIDWGDGTLQTITEPGTYEHKYQTSGAKTVQVDGVISVQYNNQAANDKLKLLEVTDASGLEISTTAAFSGCANIIWSSANAPAITTDNLSETFFRCTNGHGDINNWPVDGVLTFTNFFALSGFNSPLDLWDMNAARIISNMFAFSPFNQDITMWDTSSIVNMGTAFRGSTAFDQNLGAWRLPEANNMIGTFDFSALSDANYNLMLKGWMDAIQAGEWTPQSNVTLGAPQNTASGDGLAARSFFITNYNWIFNDLTP